MIKSILFWLIIIFLSEISNLYSQDDLKKQYEYANQLYQQEKYFDAITEFKRLIFFDKNSEYSFEANRIIGESYKSGARFDDAIKYFGIAKLNSSDDNQNYEMIIQIIRANILRNTTSRAMQLLDSLETKYPRGTKTEINYWRGWTYIFQDDWENSSQQFQLCDTAKYLADFCNEIHELKYSVEFAKLASVLFPAAGQFYTGEYLSGTMSLAWNLLTGYLSINSFAEDRVFDGIITTSLLWMRFYRGNIQNAEQFAISKNLAITNKALKSLQFQFNGTKP